MTPLSLLLRNLRYFKWSNLAVGAGVAVATAVLTGALMVGDSVRQSLRDLAVQRLGPVDHAMMATRFFRDDLAQRIAKSPAFASQFDRAQSGIIARGGAGNVSDVNDHPSERTAGVQIAALDGDWAPIAAGQCVLNGELSASLPSVKPGNTVAFTVPKLEDGPRDAALARRGRDDVQQGMQARCTRIAAQHGFLSMFNLAGGQRLPRNAWVNLAELQETVGQSGRTNVLLVHAKPGHNGEPAAKALNDVLRDIVTLDDYGLSVTPSGDKRESVLASTDTYLLRPVDDAAERAAKEVGTTLTRVSSYLVNTAAKVSDDGAAASQIHYAMIAGISDGADQPLKADEIALNQWAADRLAAKVGDAIRLSYYKRNENGDLKEVTADQKFRVARILSMTGIGVDRTLTPEYKGLTDADTVREWREPAGMTIKREWVTKDDEAYWRQYKAAPKLFVSLETGRRLWGGPFGDLTSIRLRADKAQAFAGALRKQLDPAVMGMAFRAVRAEQLTAAVSGGSQEFAGLFIGFSFFLIVAAILLVAMLFRLNVEQRARQLGLLAAMGFGPRSLRRSALAEGMLIAILGAAIGLLGAVGYTALMMAGLRTWWVDAVGTTAMTPHLVPATLAIGFVTSLVIAALAILWGVQRVGRTPAGRLLAGGWGDATKLKGRGKWSARIGGALLLLGLAMLACGAAKLMSPEEAFLTGGTLLLLGGLTLMANRLKPKRDPSTTDSIATLGFRNASRHTARSVLTMALIAFAAFVLVVTAAFRGKGVEDTRNPRSGAGGFSLMVQADIPLMGDLNTETGRNVLAVADPKDPLWSRATFTPMRRWNGQDISCLNLTRPGSPTILSVPPEMAQQNRFTAPRTIRKTANAWELLNDSELSKDRVPVITDDETAQYILHLGLGNSIDITDQTGASRKLVLVATLSGSIFQGELLMGEASFRRLFPSQGGAGVVLVDLKDPKDQPAVARLLSTELADYSATVDSTASVLAAYKNVQNTYLSTFQVLGSLGLLLGTVGLAVVLLRGIVERRSELAMLAAIGFRRIDRLRMVLAENVMLLVAGLGVGALSALIAVVPTVLGSGRPVHLAQLMLALVGILAAGLVSLVLAVWFGGRTIGVADLRAE